MEKPAESQKGPRCGYADHLHSKSPCRSVGPQAGLHASIQLYWACRIGPDQSTDDEWSVGRTLTQHPTGMTLMCKPFSHVSNPLPVSKVETDPPSFSDVCKMLRRDRSSLNHYLLHV